MIELVQNKSFLFGSEGDIKALAQKERVNILVISDSHGNRNLFRLIVATFPEKCDALVFCGDGIDDLANAFGATLSDAQLAGVFPPVAAFVAGNGDGNKCMVSAGAVGEKTGGNTPCEIYVPSSQIFRAAGRVFFVAHGHIHGAYYGLDGLRQAASGANAGAVLYGHTHIAQAVTHGGIYFMNPGSMTFPRGGLPPSCAMLSVGKDFIDTVFYAIKVKKTKIAFEPFVPERKSFFAW